MIESRTELERKNMDDVDAWVRLKSEIRSMIFKDGNPNMNGRTNAHELIDILVEIALECTADQRIPEDVRELYWMVMARGLNETSEELEI